MTPYQPPKFCSLCGFPLERVDRATVTGFDVLTGEKEPPLRQVTLRCRLHLADVWVEEPSGSWIRP